MKTTLSILQKVIVNHFYKLNAGLFMFLFYVLFGLPQNVGGFHIAVATLIVQSQFSLLIVFASWFLYNMKCIDYITKQLKAPQQQFLTCILHRGRKESYWYLSFVQFVVYLPVTAYAIFLTVIAFQRELYLVIAELSGFVLLMLLTAPLLYLKILERNFSELRFRLLNSSLSIPKTLSTIPLAYIWNNRKQMLFITKLFSLLLLFLFIKTFEPDHYDIRPVLFCFLLSAISNCTIVFEIRNFENDYLQLSKNFPFSRLRRFIQAVVMYVLLLLPELIFVWKAWPVFFHSADYLQLALSAISLLLLLHTILLTGNITMDAFIKIVFAMAMSLFFIILYNPGIILPVFILLISFALFYSYYYEFEKGK